MLASIANMKFRLQAPAHQIHTSNLSGRSIMITVWGMPWGCGAELGRGEPLPQINRMVEQSKWPKILFSHVLDLLGSFLGMDPTLTSSTLIYLQHTKYSLLPSGCSVNTSWFTMRKLRSEGWIGMIKVTQLVYGRAGSRNWFWFFIHWSIKFRRQLLENELQQTKPPVCFLSTLHIASLPPL